MYITDYVDNTKYGQSSVMDFAGYLEKESLVQEQPGERYFPAVVCISG